MSRSVPEEVEAGRLELSDSLWVPVLAAFDETHDIRTYRLARPRGFDFEAGQSLVVEFLVDGRALTCRCSISSAPETAAWLEISVKLRGEASRELHRTVFAGSLVLARPPEGPSLYPAEDRCPIVLLAGGAGILPAMSLLRHAAAGDRSRRVTLLLSARTSRDVPFRRELHQLARGQSLRVGICLTREGRHPGFLSGRIGEDLLCRAAPVPEGRHFIVLGPVPMVDRMKELLGRLGVPEGQVRTAPFDGEELDSGAAGPGRSFHQAPDRPLGVLDESGPWRRPVQAEEEAEEAEGRPAVPGPLREAGSPPEDEETCALSRSGRILRFPVRRKEIPRFRRGERMLHWSIAIPFVTCFATGMILKFFYGLHPEGISRDVLAFVHRVSGGALALFPTLAVLRNWRDYRAHLENVKVGWTWTLDDVRWLLLMLPAAVSKRFTLPDQRKFNAAERLNFMAVMVTYPVFVATGLVLWMPGIHFVPWVVHFGSAVAVTPLMFGHVHMALVNPGTRVGLSGMITGFVDREWARHHYTRWYRENFEEDGTPRS